MSSARASPTLSVWPPQSSTRVNSQVRPSETANVVRSWPTVTADERCLRGRCLVARRRDGAEQRECFEVDSDELDPRLLAGGDVAVDQVAVREDEQDLRLISPSSSRRLASTW